MNDQVYLRVTALFIKPVLDSDGNEIRGHVITPPENAEFWRVSYVDNRPPIVRDWIETNLGDFPTFEEARQFALAHSSGLPVWRCIDAPEPFKVLHDKVS